MKNFKLLPHQAKAVDDLIFKEEFELAMEEQSFLYLNSPPATGKTYIAVGFVLKKMKEEGKIVIGFGISTLIPGFIKALENAGLQDDYTVISSEYDYDPSKKIVIAMQQSIVAYAKKRQYLGVVNVFIYDEAHIAHGKNRVNVPIDFLRPLSIIGMSGTLYDSIGRSITSDKDVVDTLSPQECINQELILPFEIYLSKIGKQYIDKKTTTSEIEEAERYENHVKAIIDEFINNGKVDPRKKSIWFCPTTSSADYFARRLQDEGLFIYSYHSKMTVTEREKVINSYANNIPMDNGLFSTDKDGKPIASICHGLVSVNSVSTGFSVDDTEIVVFIGTKKNRYTYVQASSRGNRTFKDKYVSYMFDFGNNFKLHGDPCMDFKPLDKDLPSDEARKKYKEQIGHKNYKHLILEESEWIKPTTLKDRLKSLQDLESYTKDEKTAKIIRRINVAKPGNTYKLVAMLFNLMNREHCKDMQNRWGDMDRGYVVKGWRGEPDKEIVGFLNAKTLDYVCKSWVDFEKEHPELSSTVCDTLKRNILAIYNGPKSIFGLLYHGGKLQDLVFEEEMANMQRDYHDIGIEINIDESEIPF